MKVYIAPHFTEIDRGDGGIRRVVDAQLKYLPEFGVEVVETPEEADLLHGHAGHNLDTPLKPFVNSSHGMYWTEYNWGQPWADEANAGLVQAMVCANAVTAPSEWVANALRRGMLIDPVVIPHGVEADEWTPGPAQNYVLWNKARTDLVSDPSDMEKLAMAMPKQQFISTVSTPGVKLPNLQVTGVMNYDAMKGLVRHAGVQLVTTRETFGILTLEAMACGVPIAGWDYAGQKEIVTQGMTGYLAPVGDYAALAECVAKCFVHRKELSANCIADVRERWQWKDKIGMYAALYEKTYNEYHRPSPKVTVIVPCYNMERFLADALKSVNAQTLGDWECVIVDDCSTDGSAAIAEDFCVKNERFRYVKTPQNLKLCGTRNFGVKHARGKYIIFLDGDDLLTPFALSTLARVLDVENGIHIAYGHLDVMSEDGTEVRRNEWPFDEFSWYGQMAHLNQLPYCAMIRREVFERAGGYRKRHWRAEDAWFWAYVTSLGFRAEKVTDATCIVWRSVTSSKSRGEGGDGDWVAEFPWAIAHSANEARDMEQNGGLKMPNGSAVPFGAQGPAPEGEFWNVSHAANPRVAIVVRYGGDDDKLQDTLDSLYLQPYKEWDCLVQGTDRVDGVIANWAKWIGTDDWREYTTAGNVVYVNAGETFKFDDLSALAKYSVGMR